MKAMMLKELHELKRDKRTLSLLFFIPITLLIIFGFAANFTIEHTNVLIAGQASAALEADLKDLSPANTDFIIVERKGEISDKEIDSLLRSGQYDAIIHTNGKEDGLISERAHVWIDGSTLFEAGAVEKSWMQTVASDLRGHAEDTSKRIDDLRTQSHDAHTHLDDLRRTLKNASDKLSALPQTPEELAALASNPAALYELNDLAKQILDDSTVPELPNIDTIDSSFLESGAIDPESSMTILFNPELRTSWALLPGLAGLILQFIGIVITSIGLVREREAGTLEQLSVMPLHPSAILAGKVIPYFLISSANFILITAVTIGFFGVPFVGNYGLYGMTAFLFLLAVSGVGLFISTISTNTGQAAQLSVAANIPQVLLSGIIFPLDPMPTPIRWLGNTLPLTWFNKAAQGIFLRGSSMNETALPLLILTAMACVIFSLSLLKMSRLLRNGGTR